MLDYFCGRFPYNCQPPDWAHVKSWKKHHAVLTKRLKRYQFGTTDLIISSIVSSIFGVEGL